MNQSEKSENDEKMPIIAVQMPKTLVNALDEIIQLDMHANRSEVIREALRDFIENWQDKQNKNKEEPEK